jgi:hypothetical protein
MIFCLTNTYSNKSTNVGVLEFVAPSGEIYTPQWIIDQLEAKEGQKITVVL